MVQLCSGQATLVPNTMPWLKRATFVRAAVEQGKHLACIVFEHGHVEPHGAGHAARAQGRDVVNGANGFPGGHDGPVFVAESEFDKSGKWFLLEIF
jgi:xanthine/CO dehydrogenase XdhC/CoxF family maturation factor